MYRSLNRVLVVWFDTGIYCVCKVSGSVTSYCGVMISRCVCRVFCLHVQFGSVDQYLCFA